MCFAFEAGSDFAKGGGRATLLVPPLSPVSVCVPLQSADTLEKVRGIISEQLGMELDKVRCAAAQKRRPPHGESLKQRLSQLFPLLPVARD